MTMVRTSLISAYLAGPMRGIPEYNFPQFRRATDLLRNTGWKIFSPAERDEQDPDIDHEKNVAGWTGERGLDYFMAHDLKAVCEHDAVFCLPGWEQSQGARLETVTAVEIGHPVFQIEFDPLDDDGYALKSIDPDYILEVFAARGKVEMPGEMEFLATNTTESRGDALTDLAAMAEEVEGHRIDSPTVVVHREWMERGLGPEPIPTDAFDDEGAYVPADRRGPTTLPTGSAARKDVPLARGVLDYFPAALAEVARVSKAGNDKHNPGQDMHHARGKSTDHADCLLRHLVDRGKVDPEKIGRAHV